MNVEPGGTYSEWPLGFKGLIKNFILRFTFVLDSLHSKILCFSPALFPAVPWHFSLLQNVQISSAPHPVSHSVLIECPFSEGRGLRCRSVKFTIHRILVPKFTNALYCTSIAPHTRSWHDAYLNTGSTLPVRKTAYRVRILGLTSSFSISGFWLKKLRVIS